MKKYCFIPVLFCLCCLRADAQTTVTTLIYDFTPGEIEVFHDDFSGYTEGTFPSSRWKLLNETATDENTYITRGTVKKLDSVWCLYFSYGNGDFAAPHWDRSVYSTHPNDYWTIEFDFRFIFTSSNNSNAIGITIPEGPNYPGAITVWETGRMTNSYPYDMTTNKAYKTDNGTVREEKYPGFFNKNGWYHFALAYSQQGTRCYLDYARLLDFPITGYDLRNFAITGRAQVAIKNFRMARTDPAHPQKKEAVEKLLTEKKFVTHAVNFDKNKAFIKPESLSFIQQLADFLKTNPGIKLEIDGHTDSDGTPDANMTLSQNRAEAIKKQLVKMGVAPERLTTKGFGATAPIAKNATPEGMAQNRRVEFIKL